MRRQRHPLIQDIALRGARRAHRERSGTDLSFLPVEIQSLKADLAHTPGGRAAVTLANVANQRVALITLQCSSTIDPHAVPGGAMLRVLEVSADLWKRSSMLPASPLWPGRTRLEREPWSPPTATSSHPRTAETPDRRC